MIHRSALVTGIVGACGLHALVLSLLLVGPALTRTALPHRSGSPDYITLLAIPHGNSARGDQAIRAPVPPMIAPRIPMGPSVLPLLQIDAEPSEASSSSSSVMNRIAFIKKCRESYADPASLSRDLAHVSLRPGAIEISHGDRDRALMALRCLQAFGTLGATAVNPAPGS